jgi:hypothetical protein
LKFPPEFLGFLTHHRWHDVAISGKDGVSLREELDALCD